MAMRDPGSDRPSAGRAGAGGPDTAGDGHPAPPNLGTVRPGGEPEVSPAGGEAIPLSAAGDIIMGAAPGALPPSGGTTFFTGVRDALRADLQMGNLEQPLTNETGVTKCPPPASPAPGASAPPKPTCFAF